MSQNAAIMTVTDYNFCIQRTDRARDLHDLSAEIVLNEYLTAEERQSLDMLIKEKFCRLNREALGTPKPRWS